MLSAYCQQAPSPAITTVAAPALPVVVAPADAAGFTRRGDAFIARREYALAVADFSRAAACSRVAGIPRFALQPAMTWMDSD
jgi:hypothetical protein